MLRYILKRIGLFIPTILGISILIFTLIRFVPGDPVMIQLGQHEVETCIIEASRKQLGLDKPLYIQYSLWLRRMIVGNWGQSILSHRPVTYLIFSRFKYTVSLALFSMILITLIGIVTGLIAGYKVNTKIDKILRFISITFWSLPSFLTGIILIYLFALRIPILPAMGAGGIGNLILPGVTIAIGGAAYMGRITRGSLLDVTGLDFIRTAKAKGLSKKRIFVKHILRNAILPIVTVWGMQFGWTLSGSFIVETIFSYPGIGYLTTKSILLRDYPVVQGCVLFITIIICITNLIVDILYAYLDPRILYKGVV